MKVGLSIIISVTYCLPSLSSNSAEIFLQSNDAVLDGHHHLLRGRENNRDGKKRNGIKTNLDSSSISSSSTATTTAITKNDDSAGVGRRRTIVGGNRVDDEDDYPFFVQLEMGCGASLIFENIVLTAAHCVTQTDWDPNLWIGSNRRGEGIARRINGIGIHPHFAHDDVFGDHGENNEVGYDFALFSFDEPVSGNRIKPVALNRNSDYPTTGIDDVLTVIGIGLERDRGTRRSNVLREVGVPFVPNNECVEHWARERITIDEEVMLCAGGEEDRDSCDGDSGGPLLDSDGTQVGIVSFGGACGRGGWPGVYSRVSGAIDWIDDFICTNALSKTETPPSNCGRRFRVRIEIDHVRNPEQISWHVKVRDDNRSILFVPRNDSLEGLYVRTVNLSPGRYSFQIEDSGGDEIEGGTYRIGMDDQDIAMEFGDRSAVNFDVTDEGRIFFHLHT